MTALVPIIETKIVVPPARADVVARERLLALLDEASRYPLTLISAPAGFGKTTLIAEWIRARRERNTAAWLSLDAEDNQPARFHRYLVAALQSVKGTFGSAAMSLLGTLVVPRSIEVMELLLTEAGKLQAPIALVIDDFQYLTDPDLFAGLAMLVERAPAQLRVVIATREAPPLPLARWRSTAMAFEIGLEELRFSSQEAALFLRETMGLQLEPHLERRLEERTDGWIAGLQMAALSLRATGRAERPAEIAGIADFSGRHRYVVDYLAAEVMRRQSEETREFLICTSVLDRLNAALCDAVTEGRNGAAMLSRLEQANMFLIRLDNERQWFRYHHLFADFLRKDLADEQVRALHRRASRWFEANEFGGEAIRHALAANDIDAAIRLVRANVEETLSRGEVTTMLAWLSGLPESAVRLNQDLAGYKAWLLHLGGRSAEAQAYSTVVRAVEGGDAEPAHLGMLLAFRAFLALNWGDPRDAVAPAFQALERFDGRSSFFESFGLCLLGQAQSLIGQSEQAVATLQSAIDRSERLGNQLIALDATGHLAEVMDVRGSFREAIVQCKASVDRHHDSAGKPLPLSGLVHVPLGMLYYATDDLTHARDHLTLGIELCERLGMVYFWVVGKCALAKLEHAGGDSNEAWNSLADARELAVRSQSPRRQRIVAATTADFEIREGNIEAAKRTLEAAAGLAGVTTDALRLLEARLLLVQHKPSQAWRLLQSMDEQATREGAHGVLVAINVLAARCKHALGQHEGGRERLESAVSMAASANQRRVFLDEGVQLAPLLEEVREVAPVFVNELLALLLHGDTGEASGALLEPLTKSELKVLLLLNQGLTNKEIADRLTLTLGTTKWRIGQIFGKLSVRNRTEAVARGRKLKLI